MPPNPYSPRVFGEDYIARLILANAAVGGVPYRAGLELLIPVRVIDAAGTSNYDFIVPDKMEVIAAACTKRNGAGAGNTIQVFNQSLTTAISEAMACAVASTRTLAATISDAGGANVLTPGQLLRVQAIRSAGTMDADVHVYCVLR